MAMFCRPGVDRRGIHGGGGMSVTPHTEWFTIYTFQEDEGGTATVQALCEYMQETAGNHAAKLGVSMERLHAEGLAWVLARMRVVPAVLPPVHARIQVETWPVCVEGVQFRRDFIVRDEDGTVIARATSHWVVVSLAARKVVRIPAFIAAIALDNTATAMDDAKRRLPDVDGEGVTCVFRARLADVDRNHHVNNVRYMEWVLESVPEAVRAGAALAELDMTFRAESYWKDSVSVRTVPCVEAGSSVKENGTEAEKSGGHVKIFAHALVREGDGRELVRARSVWRAR